MEKAPLKSFAFHKSRPLDPAQLSEVYQTLWKAFGHQRWWPGDTPFEIIVGAILTQNTSWTNVEKAIRNLKAAKKLSPAALHKISHEELARLIKPSGYFNLKAGRLKNFIHFLFTEFQGDLNVLFREEGTILREKLLSVKGIGPETADSILLYAGEKPFFVIDAYTRRIFSRHRLRVTSSDQRLNRHLSAMSYQDWQKVFQDALPPDVALYNDFHAQIVMLAKKHCRKSRPDCTTCPLKHHL